MARSKKPRRKYSLARQSDKALLAMAKHCYLFRWDNKGSSTEFAFSSGGRYSDDLTIAALEKVMSVPTRYIVMIHACFLSGDDYYERADMWITDPVVLNGGADKIHGEIERAVESLKRSGNPRHYYDTVIVLRPASDKAVAAADDDDWIKAQAAYRADSVQRQAVIDKLECDDWGSSPILYKRG